MEFFLHLNTYINEFLLNAGVLAPIFSSLLIVLEGTFAILPLFIFVTINILSLGSVGGIVLSWACTTIGSYLCFLIFRNGIAKIFYKKKRGRGKALKFTKLLNKLKFVQVILLVSTPFIPAFLINMGAGFARISSRKYLYALLIGKMMIVIFWGYVGCNLVECLTNPLTLLKVCLIIFVGYAIGTLVNKKYKLDERFG